MNLDNQTIYKKLDKHEVADSIDLLPDQMRQVLEDARLIKIPKNYSKVTNVVVNGMGGSNLGTHILRSAFSEAIKVPISIVPGYSVPESVNKNTLFVVSTYSGNTEEPLSVYNKVKRRGAKILAITENSPKSKLAKLMIKEDIPGYMFKPLHNPSKQPRLGLGYSIFGQAVMLAKTGLFKIDVNDMMDIIASLEIWTRGLRPISPCKQNLAKRLALSLHNKIPVLVASEFLVGNLHALRNQINECAKQFADYLEVPDLNHFSIEGLVYPKTNQKNLAFMFFDSKLYYRRNKKRLALTKEIVKKNKIKYFEHTLHGKTKLTQSFELLQLGAWTSYYLGILNKVDPVAIPNVDWLKEQLTKK